MSVIKLTRADLSHVMKLSLWAKWVQFEYPELLNEEEADTLLIVDQMIMEKLHEDMDV